MVFVWLYYLVVQSLIFHILKMYLKMYLEMYPGGKRLRRRKNGHSVVYILRGQSSTSGKMLHEDLFITSKVVNKNISIKVLTEVLL